MLASRDVFSKIKQGNIFPLEAEGTDPFQVYYIPVHDCHSHSLLKETLLNLIM